MKEKFAKKVPENSQKKKYGCKYTKRTTLQKSRGHGGDCEDFPALTDDGDGDDNDCDGRVALDGDDEGYGFPVAWEASPPGVGAPAPALI